MDNLVIYSELRTSREGNPYTAYYVLVPFNDTYIKVYVNFNIYNKSIVDAYYKNLLERSAS